jgi:SNF2 family DNA or RNA helicase
MYAIDVAGPSLIARFPYSLDAVQALKLCPGWEWSKADKVWFSRGPEVFIDMDRYRLPYTLTPRAQERYEELQRTINRLSEIKGAVLSGEYAYQKTGAAALYLQQRGILADDMGLGKTYQSIRAMQLSGARRTLVLAPKSLLYTWAAELRKWAPDTAYVVYDGNLKERKALRPRTEFKDIVVITNYEKLLTDAELRTANWDCLIADEAHVLKNEDSKRHKFVKAIGARTPYVFLLTGTPLEMRVEELYNIMAVIRPAVFGGWSRFTRDHLDVDIYGNAVRVKNIQLLRERAGLWMTRRTKTEVLTQLPPKLPPVIVPVEMSKLETAAYADIKRGFAAWNPDLGVMDALVKLVRFQQLTSSPALLGIEARGSKYAAGLQLLTDWDGNAIVFSRFKQMIDLLREWLPAELFHPDAWITGDRHDPQERQRVVNDFNAGKLGKVLLGTDAMAYGLSINADLAVHWDRLWNPAKETQREDRIHGINRGVAGKPSNVAYLMCEGTIDFGMHAVCEMRRQLFHDTVDGAETDAIKSFTARDFSRIIDGTWQPKSDGLPEQDRD